MPVMDNNWPARAAAGCLVASVVFVIVGRILARRARRGPGEKPSSLSSSSSSKNLPLVRLGPGGDFVHDWPPREYLLHEPGVEVHTVRPVHEVHEKQAGERRIAAAILEIHFRESRCGQDPRSGRGHVGPAGERGEYQITPVWIRDVERLFGWRPDPYQPEMCCLAIAQWLRFYGQIVGAKTVADLVELYQRGPGGFRRWKKERHGEPRRTQRAPRR